MYKINPFSYKFGKKGESKKIFSYKLITIGDKETILLTGDSGSGKSTLLQILKGIIPEFRPGKLNGEILFNEKPLNGEYFESNLKEILYLFQNPFTQLIYPGTEEEFYFSMENFNFSREKMDQARAYFEEHFKLKPLWGRETRTLSNGECQKLVLASLLAIEPQVLLLDEPTAFLDPQSRQEFYQYFQQFRKDRTVIVIDHHLNEIMPYIDRVIYVSADGKIEEIEKNDSRLTTINLKELPDLSLVKVPKIQLKLENISFAYQKQSVLHNLNLQAQNSEVIVVRGRNGAGKSTLFKLISGVLKPDSGKITLLVNGGAVSPGKRMDYTALLFQNPETHFLFDTISEELQQSWKNNSPEDKVRNELIELSFKNLNLDKSPFLLSEGEKRRLTILMNLFSGKFIFLHDEPTFGQDRRSKKQIADLVLKLKAAGAVQIIISHDEEFIESVADRIFDLQEGQLK